MKLWSSIQSSPCPLFKLDNYINQQSEVVALKANCFSQSNHKAVLISGQSGNGISHLLQGICNEWINDNKSAYYTTGQYLIFILKKLKESDYNDFATYIMSFDIVAIDNLQFFNKKAKRFSQFLISLANGLQAANKPIYLGCSMPENDFTKIKKYRNKFEMNRIELKPISSLDVFGILKNLIIYEARIPERLIFQITSYSGTVQQYVNCLISIRFKSKIDGIDLNDLSREELDEKYKLKNYFPKQQLRKWLELDQLQLWCRLQQSLNENLDGERNIILACRKYSETIN